MEIEIAEDGAIQAVYRDEDSWLRALGHAEIKRVSNVEWERTPDYFGWTVRSATAPERALRWGTGPSGNAICVAREGALAMWLTREEALAAEIKHVWALIS